MLLATIQNPNPALPESIGFVADLAEWIPFMWASLFCLAIIFAGFKMLFRVFGPFGMPVSRRELDEVTTKNPSAVMRKAEDAQHNSVKAIEAKGREDMIAAWIIWALSAKTATNDEATAEQIRSALNVTPHRTWDIYQLQAHGRHLWALRNAAKRAGMGDALWRNLFIVAAWCDDRRDDRFDTMNGITDQRYLLHEDAAKRTKFREAYLAGGLKGVDEITRALQVGRERIDDEIRADVEREVLVEASNAQLRVEAAKRNARLAALRETRQETATRDAHAAWEKQAKELGQ